MSAQDWPDPDAVSRALDWLPLAKTLHDATLRAAARAYLRMRESTSGVDDAYRKAAEAHDPQPAEPALTIEQVIAACESVGMVNAQITIRRPSNGSTDGFVVETTHGGKPGYLLQTHFTTDTPEAAIQQLGQEAIAKLRERHAVDAAKLRELGVNP